MSYQPKTGARCSCERGVHRDNCPTCEGTGWVIDFRAIHAARHARAATWAAGDRLRVRPRESPSGTGLSYPAGIVTASEPGTAGGWDVYDGLDESGAETSFYGFSVEEVQS